MTSVGWCDGLLMARSQVVVVVFLVSGDVFHLLDERREVDMLLVGDAFRLQDDQSFQLFLVGVELKILSLPNETFALFANGLSVGVGL